MATSVEPNPATQAEPYPGHVRILLAVSVFLTALGYLYRYSNDHLRAFSQMYFEWGFAERTADIVVDIMQGTLWLALMAAPFRALRFFTIPALCSLLFELYCLCIDTGAWHPWLSLPGQALRLAPFVLILLPWKRSVLVWTVKMTAAATFIGHGIEALLTKAEFVDYLLGFFQKIHMPIREFTAVTLLHVIGTIDILLGHHIVAYRAKRARWVLRYMIFWGTITAVVRIMYYGPVAWHEVAIRNAHFLILFLLLVITRDDAKNQESSAPLESA